MTAPYVVRGDSFLPGKAHRWSETVIVPFLGSLSTWDVSPDGTRVGAVLPRAENDAAFAHLILLMNFNDELQRRTAK